MSNRTNPARASRPVSLHKYAEDNLQYIRDTMESSISFTGISGKGYVIAGVSALAAAWIAAQQASTSAWLGVWMAELALAAVITLTATALKAKSQGGSLLSSNGVKVLLAFLPSMTVGGIFTLVFYLQGDVTLLPGIWMCLYGAAMMTAGMYSVRIIPIMGALFTLLGALVLFTPLPANTTLGLGLGILHIIFGIIVWRKHGG